MVNGSMFNPKHPTADDKGFRRDYIYALKSTGLPAVRMPGGNFVSGWDWKDSIGPREKRKTHLDLAWHQLPTLDTRPIIVLFHGLAGSVRSPYAFRMMAALDRNGFNSVVMHFRGCFNEPNRLARVYHSGETGDAKAFLAHLEIGRESCRERV